MALDTALSKAIEDWRALNPWVAAAKGGALYERGRVRIPFFNRVFFLHHPDFQAEERGVTNPPSPSIQLMLLHYLLTADGTAVADEWIAFRQLPGGFFYESSFSQQVFLPLAQAFGPNLEAFRKAGLALGGSPMSRTGDAAFRFMAFPRLPIACILYEGDEEVPPSANVLFDKSAPHYLPTEDLSASGSYLVSALLQHRS
ncbi:MAG: DUF3786 domain-containing protein [Chloroflexi bacterium]|nr:DUF3786 domain-containing protein [Chloroflexota bacterium]